MLEGQKGRGVTSQIHLLFFSKSLTYFPFLTTENFPRNHTAENCKYHRILYRSGKRNRPRFLLPYSLSRVGLVSIIPETKDGLVEEASCGLQSAQPPNCRFGFFPKDFLSYLAQAGKLGVITGRRRWMCSALHLSRGEAGG